jgi:hypothetical protein
MAAFGWFIFGFVCGAATLVIAATVEGRRTGGSE